MPDGNTDSPRPETVEASTVSEPHIEKIETRLPTINDMSLPQNTVGVFGTSSPSAIQQREAFGLGAEIASSGRSILICGNRGTDMATMLGAMMGQGKVYILCPANNDNQAMIPDEYYTFLNHSSVKLIILRSRSGPYKDRYNDRLDDFVALLRRFRGELVAFPKCAKNGTQLVLNKVMTSNRKPLASTIKIRIIDSVGESFEVLNGPSIGLCPECKISFTCDAENCPVCGSKLDFA